MNTTMKAALVISTILGGAGFLTAAVAQQMAPTYPEQAGPPSVGAPYPYYRGRSVSPNRDPGLFPGEPNEEGRTRSGDPENPQNGD